MPIVSRLGCWVDIGLAIRSANIGKAILVNRNIGASLCTSLLGTVIRFIKRAVHSVAQFFSFKNS